MPLTEGDYGTVSSAPAVDTSSLLRKFGCEMTSAVLIIVTIGLAALAGVGYMIPRWSKDSYTYHQPCIECLNLGYVYNQSNNTCTTLSASNFTAFNTCPECVADSKYCGAPECRVKQPFPFDWSFGVVLTPYWVILVSSVISIYLSGVINALQIFIVRPFKKKYWLEFADDLDELEKEGGDIATKRTVYILLSVFGAMNFYWYLVLYVFAMVHYVYLIYEVCQNPAVLGGWNKFLALHLLWFNSGTVDVLGIALAQMITGAACAWLLPGAGAADESVLASAAFSIIMPMASSYITKDLQEGHYTSRDNTYLKVAFAHLIFFPLPLLVPTLLMVIPMLVVFFPMTLAMILIWTVIVRGLNRRKETLKNLSLPSLAVIIFVSRIIGTFLISIMFQTAANYAVLFYSGLGWTDTIRTEFQLRDTKCYFNALLNSVQMANIGFTGLFLS